MQVYPNVLKAIFALISIENAQCGPNMFAYIELMTQNTLLFSTYHISYTVTHYISGSQTGGLRHPGAQRAVTWGSGNFIEINDGALFRFSFALGQSKVSKKWINPCICFDYKKTSGIKFRNCFFFSSKNSHFSRNVKLISVTCHNVGSVSLGGPFGLLNHIKKSRIMVYYCLSYCNERFW